MNIVRWDKKHGRESHGITFLNMKQRIFLKYDFDLEDFYYLDVLTKLTIFAVIKLYNSLETKLTKSKQFNF